MRQLQRTDGMEGHGARLVLHPLRALEWGATVMAVAAFCLAVVVCYVLDVIVNRR